MALAAWILSIQRPSSLGTSRPSSLAHLVTTSSSSTTVHCTTTFWPTSPGGPAWLSAKRHTWTSRHHITRHLRASNIQTPNMHPLQHPQQRYCKTAAGKNQSLREEDHPSCTVNTCGLCVNLQGAQLVAIFLTSLPQGRPIIYRQPLRPLHQPLQRTTVGGIYNQSG